MGPCHEKAHLDGGGGEVMNMMPPGGGKCPWSRDLVAEAAPWCGIGPYGWTGAVCSGIALPHQLGTYMEWTQPGQLILEPSHKDPGFLG